MDLTNTFLYLELKNICTTYESLSFIDIDPIELFGLRPKNNEPYTDFNIIKRKITKKYYKLVNRYHPDKFNNSTMVNETTLSIKHCLVNVCDIVDGSFAAFINDLYQLFISSIEKSPEDLINLINNADNMLLNDHTFDHQGLKKHFDQNVAKEYITPTEEQLNVFNSKISKIEEEKLTETDILDLVQQEKNKRTENNITNIFENYDINDPSFNDIFNNTFLNTKNNDKYEDKLIEHSNNDVQAFNWNNSNNSLLDSVFNTQDTQKLSTNASPSNSKITSLDDAFGPMRTGEYVEQKMTFEQLLLQRNEQNAMFKSNALKNKPNST